MGQRASVRLRHLYGSGREDAMALRRLPVPRVQGRLGTQLHRGLRETQRPQDRMGVAAGSDFRAGQVAFGARPLHRTGDKRARKARLQASNRTGASRSDPRPEGLGQARRPGDGFLERGGSDRRDQMVHRGAGRTFQGRQIQAPGTLGLLLGRRGHPPLRGAHHSAERIHPLRRQAFLLDSLLAGQRP